jgi:hypothetical protein
MTQRLRIQRTESVVFRELAPGPRARLIQRLYDLWSSFFVGSDVDAFARAHFVDDTIVVLALGATGDLAGYGYINPTEVEVRGRRFLALGGGVFNRLEYNNSAALNLALLWHAARLRMARPGLPTVGISLTSTPIAHDIIVRMFATSAPRADFEPPPEALEIAQNVARRRGMVIDPHDPWVVTLNVRPAQPERVRASRRYAQRTPAMLDFEARVPDWDAGRALLTWAPLSADNIARSMARLVVVRRTQA